MKKLFYALTLFLIISASSCVYAMVGDVAGDIYSSDILTVIDGRSIPSYSLDGETLIALEDLESYGFNVKYDDSIRCVFINHTGSPSEEFQPEITRGTVGSIVGHYYKSDILAYVNGVGVRAYSLNGKMAAKVEDLAAPNENNYCNSSAYLMTYSYNDEKRLLSVYTMRDSYPEPEKIIADLKKEAEADYMRFYGGELEIEGGKILTSGISGTPHGTYTNYYYLGDDSLYLPLTLLLTNYGFGDYWGRIRISDLTASGDCVIFSGTKHDGRHGSYKLNPRTFELIVLEESKPDDAYATAPTVIPTIIAENAFASAVKISIDSIPVQGYSVETSPEVFRTFIDISDLEYLGYKYIGHNDTLTYIKAVDKTSSAGEILPAYTPVGDMQAADGIYTVGGLELVNFRIGDKIVVDVDDLWKVFNQSGTVNALLYDNNNISPAGISGIYDPDKNTLELRTSFSLSFKEMCDIAKSADNKIYDGTAYEGKKNIKTDILADEPEYFAVKYTEDNYSVSAFLIKDGGYIYDINRLAYHTCGITELTEVTVSDRFIHAYGNGIEMILSIDNPSQMQRLLD